MGRSASSTSKFEHPFDLTASKIRRIAQQLMTKSMLLSAKSVIATGAMRVVEIADGITVIRGHMRGVRSIEAQVSATVGLQIEGRLVGRSEAKEQCAPFRANQVDEGTLTVGGFQEETDWRVQVPRQPEFQTATITYPTDYLNKLRNAEPEFAEYALAMIENAEILQRPLNGRLQVLFARIMAADPDAPGGKLLIESLVLSVLFETLSQLCSAKSDACDPTIACLSDVIDERLRNPPTIAELSKLLRMSETSLKREFQQSKGQSIGAFITERRMETAKQLMESGLPISRVAFEVGYSTAQSFSKAFRRHYGLPPRDYRSHAGEA